MLVFSGAIIRHQYVTDSGTTYVDMVSARLADYFVVIGFDHSKQRNGSSVGKIIQRFPEFDWPDLPFFQGLELFCQPLGWTVSRRWQPPTFFIAVLTDVGADRHYCACLTFWESHGVEQTMSPDEELDDDTDNRIVKQNSGANLSDAYGAVTVLYSPKCLVLISRHEFFEVFKNSLGIVYSVYIDKMAVEIEQLVGTILGSVQVPPAGGPQLRFTIGAGDRQVLQPCGRSSIPVTGARVAVLFHQLGIHNVVTLFCAMITERKILFHSQSFTRLTDACHALSALMYPLKYSHVYVPLLPAALLEVLNTPTPFLMGVHSSLRHLITDIVDVITVDLDGGSIFLPDSAPVPPMPEPFLGRLMMWLTLVLNREVFTADRAFPSNGSNSSLSNISGSNAANNGGKNSQAMTDKQVRSCFLRLLANMLVEYRSCLQIVRIHPKPVITFHRTAFLGLRSLNESDFMCRFVDSMAFCQFVCERGVPFRSVDLFDEVYTNCSQTFVDEEVNFDLVLDNIQVLAQQLYVNENPTNQPTIVEKIPRPAEQSLSELPSPSFPLLDATKIQVLIDEGIAQMSKSPQNSPGPEGPLREVPSIPMGFRKHTGLPDGNLRRIEVMKTCLRCVFESKILEARKTLPAVLLSLKNRSVRVAFCKELAGRLHDGPGNRAQLEPQQFDLVVRMMNCALQNGSASDEYGIAYALLSLSTMYCRKLCTGVIQFAYTCIQDHPVWLNQGFWEAAFYHDVQTQIKSLYVNTTGTNVSANLVANRDNLWDLWNLYEEPRTIDVAADQMKTSATMDAGRLRELSAQEESIVYSQAIHYANRMVYLHIPLDVTKLRQLSNLNSLEDTFSSRMSNSNATNSVSNDESDRSSGAESGFVEGADGNASSRGAVVAKFVSKFVDRVCSDAGVTQEHISQLHQMTMGVIQMHIEYLEGVHRESKRLPPIRKPKMLTPSFLRDEKMLSGYQRAYLMPDGRDENLKLVEKALLPAEGTVFLTNYRIIFKGQPCNPYLSEKVVMRVIPVMAMTKQKKIGQQYLSHGDQSGQFLSEAIQIRSTTFQLMKLAFDDEVGAEKVESFCTALTNLRWSETLSGQLYALSSTVADPTADMDTLKPGKKGNTFSRNIKKTLNVAAKKTGLTGTLNKAMFNGGNHFKGGQTKYSMTGVTSPLTLNTAASTQSSTLPSSPKRQSPASDDESDRSTPTRDEDVVSATPNGRSGSLSRTLEKLSERPYCHDYQRLGLCSRAEVTLHSGAALTRTGSTSLKATEGPFRLTTINKSYSVCRSYPSLLVVPHNVNDESLRKLAKGHKHGRFPVVVWSSSRGAFLMRAAGFHLKSVVGRLKGKAQTMAAGGSTKDYSDRTQAPAESLSTGLKSRAEQELYFLNLVTIATRANLNNIGHSSSGTSDAALGSPVNLSGSNESLLSIDSLLLGSLDSVSITGVPSSSNLAGMNGNNQGDNSSLYSTPVIDRRFGGTPLSSLSRYMKGSGGKGLGLKFNTMRPGRPLSTVGSNLSVPSLTSGRKTNGNSGVKDSGPPALQRASLYIFGEKSQAKTLRLDTKCHFVPIEFTEVRQMKASLKKFLRVVAPSSAPEANSSFLRELEQSEWLQQIKLMIQVSCAVIDLVDIQNSSVAICLEDGYDFTPQVVSLSQLMLDPFYRTIDGFRVLVEKEWLSFGHRFSHRCNHTFASSTSGFAPVFLQFLDAVHQIHRQFPESFEFNDFYLRFIAYHSVAAYFQTFLFDCEADRVEEGLIHYEGFYPHSQWKSIGSPHHPSSNPPPVPHRSGRSESTSVDPGNTADHLGRSSAHLVDSMSKRANSLGRAQRAEQLLHSSLFDYIDSKHSHGSLFYNFLYAQHSVPNRVLRPQFCVAALDLWDYYVEDPLALGSTYDLEGAQAELTERQTDEADLLDGSGNLQSSGRKQIDLNYDSVDFVNQNPFQLVLEEIYNAEAEPTKKFLPRRWDDVLLKIRQIMQREEDESEQIVDATSSWATWLNRAMHKKSTVELLLRGRSKELGRFQNVGGDSQPHQFVRHNFSGAHNCDFCGHIIWGVVSQGLKCSACDYICHEKCQIDVPNHCRNTHANTETNTMRNPLIIEEAPRMVSETRTHEGYLFKRGHLLKGWKQRWFVLDSMKHQLRYYECMEDSECRGYIDLGEVVSIDPVMSTLPNAPRNKIEETYFDLKTTRREYHFAAASAQQAQEWIEKIRQCVTA